MKYLLDVNALLALGFQEHEFHKPMSLWVKDLASKNVPQLASTVITELGFARILCQAPQYGLKFRDAQTLLSQLKKSKSLQWTFLNDNLGVERMPLWVKSAKQITDGHLVELAKEHGAMLSTFDRGISGAFLIPS